MAGIKVNTDDTPEYKVYGLHTGKISGVNVNSFYITGINNNCWSSTSSDGYVLGLISTTRTQRPGKYGYALWVTDYRSNSWGTAYKCFSGLDKGCFGWVCGSVMEARVGFNYAIRTVPEFVTAWTKDGTLSDINTNDLCNCYLSDKFESLISIYKPSFPLYDFLDSGEITFGIRRIHDGFTYEGGENGGRTGGTDEYEPLGKNQHWGLYLEHQGAQTKFADFIAQADQTLVQYTKSVAAGDRIVLKQDGNPKNMYTGAYSIAQFWTDLPGWKKADET